VASDRAPIKNGENTVAAPESSDMQQLVEQIAARIGRALERRGTLKVGGQSMAGGPARRRTGGPNSPSKARGS
jgi:hypothetical protein